MGHQGLAISQSSFFAHSKLDTERFLVKEQIQIQDTLFAMRKFPAWRVSKQIVNVRFTREILPDITTEPDRLAILQ